MFFVNHPTMVKSDIPFGGAKISGYASFEVKSAAPLGLCDVMVPVWGAGIAGRPRERQDAIAFEEISENGSSLEALDGPQCSFESKAA